METTKFFISIVAVIFTVVIVRTEIREFGRRVYQGLTDQNYEWDGNGVQSIICLITGILWVVIYYL